MKTRILYATNGVGPALSAGELLRRLANPECVSVTIDVCRSVEFAFPQQSWTYGEERRPRAQPEELAHSEMSLFHDAGFNADLKIGSGAPAHQILEEIRNGSYDVAVLGAGSSRWLENLLLGSTSTRVLHASPTSVLITHRFQPAGERLRALVATDGSPDADLALETFTRIADPKKVQVKLFSVAESVDPPIGDSPEQGGSSQVEESDESRAGQLLERVGERLASLGFTCETETSTGPPVRQIVERAQDADLVVVGSRGLGPVSRFMLGSVSDQVARLAPAALICRRPQSPPPA